MKDVVIVSACRTAVGSFGGSLKDVHAYKIGSAAMKEAVRRAGIDPAVINDVRFGNCIEPYNALNVARVAALDAGIPETSTAVTINRVCISGMEAVQVLRQIQPGVRVVASSSFFASDDSKASCMNLGFDDILPKPYSATDLTTVMERNARKSSARIAA